jgi:twitching motility protein PilJ
MAQQFQLQSLSNQVIYWDEVLTMSARLGASTGDPRWQARYDQSVPELDQTLQDLQQLAPKAYTSIQETNISNTRRLVALERQAFILSKQGKPKEALALLLGSEYENQKKIYSQGIQKTQEVVRSQVDTARFRSFLFLGIILPTLLGTWVVSLSLIQAYSREQELRVSSLLRAQQDLKRLNQDLEDRVQERTIEMSTERIQVQKEKELLETDVGHLLDLVAKVESGDLSVQLPITTNITGLIADTLNRLFERLSKILTQVSQASYRIQQTAQQMQKVADQVNQKAVKQAQEVTQVLNAAQNAQGRIQRSAAEIIVVNQKLNQMDQSVRSGQTVIQDLVQGIEVLRAGTHRTLQQMQLLDSLASLVDRALQEHDQTASLLQMISMSATLLAARASEQTDPRQVLPLIREFEALAQQIQTLSRQTQASLVPLQDGAIQIQTIVTTVNNDIESLSRLVAQFQLGVDASKKVFTEIRSSTDFILKVEEGVARSSQDMVTATEQITAAMNKIVHLAGEIARSTELTQSQTTQMSKVSSILLRSVQFFQLPGRLTVQK